jgi:hypothetical protein
MTNLTLDCPCTGQSHPIGTAAGGAGGEEL